MFNTIISFAALMLPCHSFTAAFAQDPVAVPQPTRLMEEQIGLTLFQPRHAGARDLIDYAKDLTESHVQYLVGNSATGKLDVRQRERFVPVGNSIAVQGDAAGRKKGVDFLTELDAFMGQSRAERLPEAESLVRTVRLRSMSVASAVQLLDAMAANVEKQVVAEAGTIVLRGATEAVARAEALLLEVDKPAPQMTLHVTLIEATDGAPVTPVGGDLGKSLSTVMPGKQFQQVGRFMLRGSVAGNTPIELSTSFGDLPDVKSKFVLRAHSRSWDAERKVMTLGRCEVQSERPRFTTQTPSRTTVLGGLGTPPGAQETEQGPVKVMAGFDQEGFSTDLALNVGQDTVVGSLGGNALLVVLRFTVDASVD